MLIFRIFKVQIYALKCLVYIGVLVLLTVCSAAAQPPDALSTASRPGFIENKGQIIDQNNNPNPAVLYLLNTPGMNVQLRRGGFSYDVYTVTNSKVKSQSSKLQLRSQNLGRTDSAINYQLSIINYHRIDFELIGSDPDYEIVTTGQSSDFLNFYTTGVSVDGVTGVRSFQTVTYKSIYPGIDLEFISSDVTPFKYNFIIHPGGNIQNLMIRINGPEQIIWTSDSLNFLTSAGEVCDYIPECYYQFNSSKIKISSYFHQISPQTYGFSIEDEVPENATLVIDPTSKRIWGTYYGGSIIEEGNCLSVDPFHNVYLTGITNSLNNIATSGAYQTTKQGPFDNGFLVKLNASGVRQWGTYYGGDSNGMTWVFGSACDLSGYIYIAGTTNADSGIASPGAHQELYGGGNWDAFLVKFNTNGERIWATYYGGEDSDEVWHSPGVSVDNSRNVYLCGTTGSESNISTSGAYQETLFPAPQNAQDAFLVKFDSNGLRQWGTYYGGDYPDYFNTCVCDPTTSTIFVAGATNSNVNIASPGAFQTVYGGVQDGFLEAFTSDGEKLWGTYFGGSQIDDIKSLAVGNNGFVYIGGWTESTSGISSPGSFQPNSGGGHDGFIGKFSDQGQRIWSSYYGGTMSDYVLGCAVSTNGDVFFTGDAGSLNGIATPNSYMPVYGGGVLDGFLVKFDSSGQRQWGTYFGGTGKDELNYCSYVAEDTVFLAGTTNSTSNISTPDAHQKLFGGWYDAILEKFIECWQIDTAGPISGIANVCVNTTDVIYSIPPLDHAVDYVWTIPPGSTIKSGNGTMAIIVDFSSSATSGFIRVKGLNKCGDPGDSANLYVMVHQLPVPGIFGNDTTCTGPGKIYTSDPGKTNYQWSISAGGVKTAGGNTTDDFITVTWNNPGIQTVQVNYTDTNGCTALTPAVLNVLVIPGPPVSITITASANNICTGNPVTFTATPVNGGINPTYQWNVNGVNAGTNNPIYTYIPASGDLVSCLLSSSDTCTSNNPATSNTVTMIVSPAPVVTFTSCFDTITTLNAKPINLKGGIPLGGTYSGPGVNPATGVFTPASAGVGIKTIAYIYTNVALCSASKSRNIIVQIPAAFTCGNNITDIRDNKVYPTIQIGSQCWMAENLDYGTQISESIHQRDNCIAEKYYRPSSLVPRPSYYQWDELMRYEDTPGQQGFCPPGWHIPTEADWNTLFANWTNNAFAGAPLKYSGYSGFDAFLPGVRHQVVQWNYQDFATFFWSSTPYGPHKAWAHGMNDTDYSVSYYPSLRSNAFSVRCVRD